MAIGIRTRLALTLVALVAVTVAAIGVGVYAFVDASLRDAAHRRRAPAGRLQPVRAAPGRRPAARPTRGRSRPAASPTAFALRGLRPVLADFGDGVAVRAGRPSGRARGGLAGAARHRAPAASWATRGRTSAASRSSSSAGARAGRPDLFFVFPAAPVEDGARPAAASGCWSAGRGGDRRRAAGRRADRPLAPAPGGRGRAARRGGSRAATSPPASRSGGRDEFGRWAAEFNRMADSLEATVARLETAQQQNRRFVADVAARAADAADRARRRGVADRGVTPDDAAPTARRAGGAARRRRAPPAGPRRRPDGDLALRRRRRAASPLEPVDLGRVVTGAVAARLPEAAVSLPADAARRETPTRGASTGSWATCSTTPASTPRGPRSRSRSRPRGTAPSSSSRTAGRGSRPTPSPTCSTASTRPTRRGPRAAPAWASRSPPSTRRCWAARCGRGPGRAAGWCSR